MFELIFYKILYSFHIGSFSFHLLVHLIEITYKSFYDKKIQHPFPVDAVSQIEENHPGMAYVVMTGSPKTNSNSM